MSSVAAVFRMGRARLLDQKKCLLTKQLHMAKAADSKNEEIFKTFVLECEYMLIYFDYVDYLTETTEGRKRKRQPRTGKYSPNALPTSTR